MISSRWIEKRKPYWDRLALIIEKAGRRGSGVLSYAELSELGLLYRQIAADLAAVREDPLSRPWAGYLNQLLARAHNLIYMGRTVRPRSILGFYGREFPRLFRETWKYTALAFMLFIAGALAGFLATLADPALQRFFLGPEMSATIDRREMWTHSVVTIKPLASSAIMTNNISVGFMTFALGITAGLGAGTCAVSRIASPEPTRRGGVRGHQFRRAWAACLRAAFVWWPGPVRRYEVHPHARQCSSARCRRRWCPQPGVSHSVVKSSSDRAYRLPYPAKQG